MKKYLFILVLFLCGTASILSAQSIDIQGVVVDENGESVVGVAVLVAGSKTAAITDVAGDLFRLGNIRLTYSDF